MKCLCIRKQDHPKSAAKTTQKLLKGQSLGIRKEYLYHTPIGYSERLVKGFCLEP